MCVVCASAVHVWRGALCVRAIAGGDVCVCVCVCVCSRGGTHTHVPKIAVWRARERARVCERETEGCLCVHARAWAHTCPYPR
jgi:hypothetical protein